LAFCKHKKHHQFVTDHLAVWCQNCHLSKWLMILSLYKHAVSIQVSQTMKVCDLLRKTMKPRQKIRIWIRFWKRMKDFPFRLAVICFHSYSWWWRCLATKFGYFSDFQVKTIIYHHVSFFDSIQQIHISA